MSTFLKTHSKKIFIIKQSLFLLLLSSCSSLEDSEKEKMREKNAKREYIYRSEREHLYPIPPSVPQERDPYPWERQ